MNLIAMQWWSKSFRSPCQATMGMILAGCVSLVGCQMGPPQAGPTLAPPQAIMPGQSGPQLVPGQPPFFPSGQPQPTPAVVPAPPAVKDLPAPTTETRAPVRRNSRLIEHGLAVKATRAGHFAEADVHFLRAWQQGPPTAELLNDMGYRLYAEGRLSEAESVYRQAMFLEPHHVAATLNLGRVLARQGRVSESLAVFRQVNTEAEAEANVAYVLADWGNLDAAVAHYGRSSEISVAMRSNAQNPAPIVARLPSSSPSDFPLGPQQADSPQNPAAPIATARITQVRPAAE